MYYYVACDALADLLAARLPHATDHLVVFPSRLHPHGFAIFAQFFGGATAPADAATRGNGRLTNRGDPAGGAYVVAPPAAAGEEPAASAVAVLQRLVDDHCTRIGGDAATAVELLGFSKGGVVLNQLVTELALALFPAARSLASDDDASVDTNSGAVRWAWGCVRALHYVDSGLNTAGAFVTDAAVLSALCARAAQQLAAGRRAWPLHVALLGTWRQWDDARRPWIDAERRCFAAALERSDARAAGALLVTTRYLGPRPADVAADDHREGLLVHMRALQHIAPLF